MTTRYHQRYYCTMDGQINIARHRCCCCENGR